MSEHVPQAGMIAPVIARLEELERTLAVQNDLVTRILSDIHQLEENVAKLEQLAKEAEKHVRGRSD